MKHIYLAVVEGQDDNFSAFVPDVLGAVGAGDTLKQAVASLGKSLAVQLEDLRGRGLEAPVPRTDVETVCAVLDSCA